VTKAKVAFMAAAAKISPNTICATEKRGLKP